MANRIIQGWEWIPFIIGLLSGFLNPVFWILFIILLLLTNKRPYNLAMRMFYVWGILTIIVVIGAAIFTFLLDILI